jgi:DNA-binding MarR family transcriptional regulator
MDHLGAVLLSYRQVLLKLAWAPDRRLRMTQLAAQCLLTPGGVTRVVGLLVDAGLVRRSTPADNRRVVMAELTDPGFAVLEQAQHTHLAGVRALFLGHLDTTTTATLAAAWQRIQDADPAGLAGAGSG